MQYNTINLYQYIKHGLILKNLEEKNPFDLIIYDYFNNKELEIDPSIEIMSLHEMKLEFGFSGHINGLCQKFTNVLLIIDELDYYYLFPLIKNIDNSKTNITIINLGTGISGLINKNNPNLHDIATISSFDLKIYEPFDVISLFQTLNIRKQSKYIRIANKDLPTNLLKEMQDTSNITNGTTSLSGLGLDGDKGTILCGGYMVNEAIGALNSLREKSIFYDMFIITEYGFKIDEELLTSLKKTNKFIIILDQKSTSNYINILKAKLRDIGLIDPEIQIIFPKIEKIQTNLPEYIFEAGEFDSKAFEEILS